MKTFQIWPWKTPLLNDRSMVTLINRAQQRLSLCPFGNNLVTLGLHGEQFQKITKNFFFQRFRRKLVSRPKEENEIKKAFISKASHRLSEMFRDAQNENKRSFWIGDHAWNDMLSHWNAPEYRSKVGVCTQVVLLACKITPLAWYEFGQSVYVDEDFQQTHLQKDIGRFIDDRSRQTHARLSQARSNVASSFGESELTPLDPAEEHRLRSWCWDSAAGPKRSSSRTQDATEINLLKEELHQSKEEMRNIIHQHQQPHQQQQQDNDQADDQQQHDDL
ncbi:hypothetical protein GmHk_06G016907 [Glycine max]|nr:hypothetical protein GmHk_06G016907 [Glycine max]